MRGLNLPNFIIIGAPKCGTTSLYHYMNQHPDVYFSPIKEPQYFAFAGETPNFKGPGVSVNSVITDSAEYSQLFAGAGKEKAIGEASALYLSSPKAAALIREKIPDVRLIVILRNPVDRAFSSYMHLKRDGREPIADFLSAVAEEEQRIADNWGFLWRYKQLGQYYSQLKTYYEIFDRQQILVLLHENLQNSSASVLSEAFCHLGVDASFKINAATRYNISGVPRIRWAYDLIYGDGAVNQALRKIVPQETRQLLANSIRQRILRREKLDASARKILLRDFKGEILQLQDLIHQDLDQWLI